MFVFFPTSAGILRLRTLAKQVNAAVKTIISTLIQKPFSLDPKSVMLPETANLRLDAPAPEPDKNS